MRKKLIAGNWKMNFDKIQAEQFVDKISDKINTTEATVVLCVPYTNLASVYDKIKNTNIKLGAENVYFETSGAFTGEISCDMLKSVGVSYVIIGHSERREYFNETNEIVNKKVKKVLDSGLMPILCVGESLHERQISATFDLIRLQLRYALHEVTKEQMNNVVIAYEPIWAIGTGLTATNLQAEEVCKDIRETIEKMYDKETADKVQILYGGSVNGGNANTLFGMDNIDGGLVGGASLKDEFINIVNFK